MASHSKVSTDVLCVIANYDFNENASKLKQFMKNHWKTYLVDSSSPTTPIETDFVIPNQYYPGLLRKAYDLAKDENFEWLLFIASDVQLTSFHNLVPGVLEAMSESRIGIYSPSLTRESRCAFPPMFNRPQKGLREVGIVEGFFFLTRIKFLEAIDDAMRATQFGWGLDVLMCYDAFQRGYSVVVDDRVTIFHPTSNNPVDEHEAMRDLMKFVPYEVLQWKNGVMEAKSRTS